MTLQDDVNTAGAIANASTKAAVSAALIGIVPLIEFGALVALTMIIVAVPLKLIKRLV